MTDARQRLEPTAIEELMRYFADSGVGVVSGELVFDPEHQTTTTARGMGAYWEYEKMIRKQESAGGSVPGATGALYAIRRELAKPIPADTLLDDVALPMLAMETGARCVFQDKALAYDIPSQIAAKESVRKRRTIAGVFQLVAMFPRWWLPGGHPCWFSFASHKVTRLVSPLALVTTLVCNSALLNSPGYQFFICAQMLFYSFAWLGWWMDRTGRHIRGLGLPFMFLAMNVYTVLAFSDLIRGKTSVAWHK